MEQVVGTVRPEIKGLFANIFKYEGNITLLTSRREVPSEGFVQHVARWLPSRSSSALRFH